MKQRLNGRNDFSVRKEHYGAGRQPWDEIKDAGWAPAFAAGNVLKYLRRDKAREHSIESARWYWDQLHQMVHGDRESDTGEIIVKLRSLITDAELMVLELR